MGRVVVANTNCDEDLSKLPENSVGLIIGQPVEDKDYVVFLARTALEDADKSNDTYSSSIANHALNVSMMLPAGFFVLGMFVVDAEDVFNNKEKLNLIESWVTVFQSTLKSFTLIHTGIEDLEKLGTLVLHYSHAKQASACKTIIVGDGNKLRSQTVEWQFKSKPINWTQIECNYELEKTFPLIRRNDKLHMEEHLESSLEEISNLIGNTLILFDDEIRDETRSLESFASNTKTENHSIQATVYQSFLNSVDPSLHIAEYEGTLQFNGIIASKVWLHPKQSIKKASQFVKMDIIRSLAARIRIHCDALNENEHIEDHVVINEPPRRVFFPIKPLPIQFSDYIFRGEDEETVMKQTTDLLGIVLQKNDIMSKAEFFSEDVVVDDKSDENNMDSKKASGMDKNIFVIIGIVGAFSMLILSVVLHFVLQE